MPSFRAKTRQFARTRQLLALAVAILTAEIVGASGAIFTAQGLSEWYGTLQRPELAPPNWVFGPVWTILFALIGIALWLVWRQADSSPQAVRLAGSVFALHFAFNLGWSAVFFGMQEIGLGLAVILALWSNAAYAIALLCVIATILILQRTRGSEYALLEFGLLALPLGLPAAYEAYRWKA